MLEKKPFVRYDFEPNNKKYVFSVWLNEANQVDLYNLGCMLRESKPSTIIKKCMEIALAKLTSEEKIIEMMYKRGINNRRNGLDELDTIKQQLSKLLNKPNADLD